MKIALIYDPIYPYVIGGAEKRYREFAGALAKMGHEVTLVGMKYWQGDDLITENGVRLNGICKAVPLYAKSGGRSLYESLYFGFHVFVHLLKNNYDVVDCCTFPYFSAAACRLAIALRGKKACGKFVITWLEVWDKNYWKKYSGALWFAGYLLEILVSKLTKNNIAISVFTADRMSEVLGVDKATVRVIPCGIDFKALKELRSPAKEDKLIYVGRIISHKNLGMLIMAFREVVAGGAFPGLRLKIIGKGPDEQNCKWLAAKLGLESRVDFSDFLPEAELFKEIAASKIFVLPSEREGLGIVAVESMALGTPVAALSAKYSAVKEIVSHNFDGIMFDDEETLKAALIKYIRDNEFYAKIIDCGYKTAARYDLNSVTGPALENYYKNAHSVC